VVWVRSFGCLCGGVWEFYFLFFLWFGLMGGELVFFFFCFFLVFVCFWGGFFGGLVCGFFWFCVFFVLFCVWCFFFGERGGYFVFGLFLRRTADTMSEKKTMTHRSRPPSSR